MRFYVSGTVNVGKTLLITRGTFLVSNRALDSNAYNLIDDVY
jgi:hypothetical protein